ncbi:MAG: hypothetical protein H0X26_05130 [Alphaproteobacteria bacterium]|nr:hypothetical protein [Alphaproteobacteria bacterium]
MKVNIILSLLATCATLVATPSFAMEIPEIETGNVAKSTNISDGFLSPEEIKDYNTEILAPYKAKINYTFNPDTVENIVVGCDILMHSTHFFGGHFQNGSNKFNGYIVQGGAYTYPTEMRDRYKTSMFELPPIIWPNYQDNKLACSYKFAPCNLLNYRMETEEKFERGLHTTNHSEAFKYALSKEGGKCRLDEKGNIWEVDPEKSIYINFSGSNNHIEGSFEGIIALPFLKNVKKIIIEYYDPRLKDNYKKLIQNAYTILAPGGMLLMEVGPMSTNERTYKFTPTDIRALSLPDFQLKLLDPYKGENPIPCRGQCNDGVYSFQAIKK